MASNRLFYSTDHAGHWPVGVASVVLAPDEEAARALLTQALRARGLPAEAFNLNELALAGEPRAFVLLDGNY